MKCVDIGFFTVNRTVIFLKYTLEFVLNTGQCVLNVVCQRKFREKGDKSKTFRQISFIVLSSVVIR